jgi:hypothetical protein
VQIQRPLIQSRGWRAGCPGSPAAPATDGPFTTSSSAAAERTRRHQRRVLPAVPGNERRSFVRAGLHRRGEVRREVAGSPVARCQWRSEPFGAVETDFAQGGARFGRPAEYPQPPPTARLRQGRLCRLSANLAPGTQAPASRPRERPATILRTVEWARRRSAYCRLGGGFLLSRQASQVAVRVRAAPKLVKPRPAERAVRRVPPDEVGNCRSRS